MKILGIETSCDETSAAVIDTQKRNVKMLSNVIASSLTLHAKTGGIVPEVAAREQIKYIIPVIKEALEKADTTSSEIDAIAITYGPGLVGSLLIGVETAKTLSFVWEKPLIAVNHLIGHIYANWIDKDNKEIQFPALSLIISGGHTDLVLIKKHGAIKWLGGTRDDAAGEAFDKIGRLLELPYPGGPHIEKEALKGNEKKINFPKAMLDSGDFDFSFSGLKSAAMREIVKLKESQGIKENDISDICASLQKAIIDVLIKKSLKAAEKYKVKSLVLSGGVSANQKLRDEFKKAIEKNNLNFNFFATSKNLSTDNADMIASAAFFDYHETPWAKLEAKPELYFD